MGKSMCTFKYATSQKHPIIHTHRHECTHSSLPPLYIKFTDLYYDQQDHKKMDIKHIVPTLTVKGIYILGNIGKYAFSLSCQELMKRLLCLFGKYEATACNQLA